MEDRRNIDHDNTFGDKGGPRMFKSLGFVQLPSTTRGGTGYCAPMHKFMNKGPSSTQLLYSQTRHCSKRLHPSV